LSTRRIVLFVLAALVLFGVGNFLLRSFQIRQELAKIAGSDAARQEQGIRNLIARGALFDALQGGAPPATRLKAIAALERVAARGNENAAFDQLLQMLKDPDTESAEAKTHPVRDAATAAVARAVVEELSKSRRITSGRSIALWVFSQPSSSVAGSARARSHRTTRRRPRPREPPKSSRSGSRSRE